MLGLPHDSAMSQTSSRSLSISRRNILLYPALLLSIVWATYLIYTRTPTISSLQTALNTNSETSQQPSPNPSLENKHYQGAATPAFADMIQLLDLPPKYMPETGKHRRRSRLIIVGDVHGQKDSLVKLLEKVNFNKKTDHLVLAGDMISKGPDSPGVIDLAMKLGATGVRGNHEDRVLLVHAHMEKEHADMNAPGPDEGDEKTEDELEELSFSHGDYKDRALVRALGKKRMKWLKKCPVILRVGECGSMGEVVVVHAGLVPGMKLERQDPAMVMNMRTITDDGVPSDARDGKVWQKVWNKYQKSLPKRKRSTVIYGHDAKRGLQLGKYSMGIDTGCLKGGKLTAVVIEGANSDFNYKLVHVNCPDGRAH